MTIGIIGCGLIGGSIGLAARSNGHRVLGFDLESTHGAVALERGCVDEMTTFEEVAKSDIVFLCVPPSAVVSVAGALRSQKGLDTIVTDCTSVKGPIVRWLSSAFDPQFVPGHPMAGHEKSGPKFSSGWMFRGATWIFTPTPKTSKQALKGVENLVSEFGAKCVRVDADRHDYEVALMSHLPHAIAAALVQMAAPLDSTDASGGSWRDLTRVGGVDPGLWSQILIANGEPVVQVLDDFKSRINGLLEALKRQDIEAVKAFFLEAQKAKAKQR